MTTHADVIAKRIAKQGVEYVFGLPGGETVAFIDACRRAGMRFLLTGHESSAALIAQVVGQITGIPGVCSATLGPGATNLVTGVASALLERSPLLAVTAQIPSGTIRTMSHQRFDLHAIFSPITKNSVAVGSEDTEELIDRSLALAAEPRPGPVHLVLPSDLALAESNSTDDSQDKASRNRPNGKETLSGKVAELAARVLESKRPLLILGLGVSTSTAPLVSGLVETLKAPFLLTPKAKGILPEDHPLFLGVASGMAIDREVINTIQTADLLIGIGFDPVECDKTWFADTDVVSIDSASMSEGSYTPFEVLGEISSLLTQLIATIGHAKPWPEDLLRTRRQAVRRCSRPTAKGVSPLALLEGLRSVFPRDGIATCDVGSHKYLMGQFWRCYLPGTFFMSNGLSGMGYGLPAAIAAQLVFRERKVLAVVGDGGMLMMLHDLVLIRELQLPIIIVVLTDCSLSLIRVAMERRGFAAYGVDFRPPDFAAVANSFGIRGERVASVSEAKVAVEQALTKGSPLVLDVPIDFREYYDLV